ncbi:MAG: hypothetical protein KAS32_04020 [Candidatus Peribacteraceae bacterium]|nr:hypothetical protein [Candidatus Peribacteraceae bacterium]
MVAAILFVLWSGLGLYDYFEKGERPSGLLGYFRMGPIFWIIGTYKWWTTSEMTEKYRK